MRILKEDTAALVIDYQSRLYPFINENELLTKNSVKLIEGLRILEIPIIVTEQYPKGIGYTIPEIQEALGDNYKPLGKMTFSCCGDENFISLLKSFNKKNILVCGIESHVCVLQTVVDLIQTGYRAVVVADCISSRNTKDYDIAIERMRSEGAIITTYESILFEMLKESGTERFKKISRIVK